MFPAAVGYRMAPPGPGQASFSGLQDNSSPPHSRAGVSGSSPDLRVSKRSRGRAICPGHSRTPGPSPAAIIAEGRAISPRAVRVSPPASTAARCAPAVLAPPWVPSVLPPQGDHQSKECPKPQMCRQFRAGKCARTDPGPFRFCFRCGPIDTRNASHPNGHKYQ